jgi:hypothetical protein
MPDDILLNILQAVVDGASKELLDIYDATACTKAMLVCGLLRDVLIDLPLVWSKISVRWLHAQYEVYMSRARGTPLSVKDFSSLVDPHLYVKTATSVHLDFTIVCPTRRTLIDDALKRDVSKQDVLTMIEAQTRVPELLLNGELLGGNCCLLRELTVVGFLSRSVLNLSGLTQLTVDMAFSTYFPVFLSLDTFLSSEKPE